MISLTPPAAPALPGPFDVLRVDERSDEELDAQPFGIICLDAAGKVLRYNLAEARLARLDRNQVVGRNFFKEIAPCTQRPEFQGRFADFVLDPEAARTLRFEYLFDFKFGAQQVEVELVRTAQPGRFYLCINRRKFLPAREKPFQPAPLQEELAPGEQRLGVLRGAAQGRKVEVSPAFFEAMRATWDRVAPKGWSLFCAEWGLKWGRLALVDLETQALEESGKSLREQPMKQVVSALGSYLQLQGWGQTSADFGAAPRGAFVLELSRCALAESVGWSEVPRCHLLAGFFRAFFGHLANKLLEVREVSCSAQGHDRCSFVVVSLSRVAALEDAIAAGGGELPAVLAALSGAARAGA